MPYWGYDMTAKPVTSFRLMGDLSMYFPFKLNVKSTATATLFQVSVSTELRNNPHRGDPFPFCYHKD